MVISVIIATYNASKTLARCLDSIIPQLTEECELIIIDGNSSDSTNEIIKAYNEISYTISEPDKGVYDAWNKGIKVSKGNWIMFVGADDALLPNALNTYLKLIHSRRDINEYDYICAHNEYVDKQGHLLKILGENAQWYKMKKMMCAAHVASLHNKKNLFEQVGLYNTDYKICGDYELLLRKGSCLHSIFMPERIAKMEAGGISFSSQAIIEVYKIRKEHKSISELLNLILFIRDWLAFKTFVLRKTLKNKKL